MLTELMQVGSRERPVAVLQRLGLVVEDPMPVAGDNGRRWRGTTSETHGAIVWDVDCWGEPAVRAILLAAIGTEPNDEQLPALGLVAE